MYYSHVLHVQYSTVCYCSLRVLHVMWLNSEECFSQGTCMYAGQPPVEKQPLGNTKEKDSQNSKSKVTTIVRLLTHETCFIAVRLST